MLTLSSYVKNYANDNGVADVGIEKIAAQLCCHLPSQMIALYKMSNGMAECPPNAVRLMSDRELVDSLLWTKARGWYQMGIRLIFVDDNSNYVGIYVEGPLTGMVCRLRDLDTDPSPAFTDINEFLSELIKVLNAHSMSEFSDMDIGWINMEGTLPVIDSTTKTIGLREALSLARRPFEFTLDRMSFVIPKPEFSFCVEYLNAEPIPQLTRLDRLFIARTIINLTWPGESKWLLRFALDHDMWISEYACCVIGKRMDINCVQVLIEVLAHGGHNSKIAARAALTKFGVTS